MLTTSYDTEVIVVTGSVGVADQLRRLPAEHGARWVVDAVAVRPGHPQLCAQLTDCRGIVSLAGNPYADLPAAHTPLAPFLAGLTGRPLPALPRIPLTGDIAPPLRRTDKAGRRCHWILEIHLVDRGREFGGFYEELLDLG